MKWQLLFSSAAARDYKNLDRQIATRIKEKLRAIEQDPLSSEHSKALVGQPGLRSARVGNWRILFKTEDTKVKIDRIRHRREVYKNL